MLRAEEMSLSIHGAQYFPNLVVPLLDRLHAIADGLPRLRAGTRMVGNAEVASLLAPHELVGRKVADCAGRPMFPVRAILFDKTEETNWSLSWHQDRTIAVKARRDVPGYGPWTVKQGLPHVQPPFAVTEAMLTVRIHLDDVDETNAPLLIAPGSHLRGLIPAGDVDLLATETPPFACLASAGDVWIYRTPILHASRPAAPGRRRRVLQADYSGDALPDGLEWQGI